MLCFYLCTCIQVSQMPFDGSHSQHVDQLSAFVAHATPAVLIAPPVVPRPSPSLASPHADRHMRCISGMDNGVIYSHKVCSRSIYIRAVYNKSEPVVHFRMRAHTVLGKYCCSREAVGHHTPPRSKSSPQVVSIGMRSTSGRGRGRHQQSKGALCAITQATYVAALVLASPAL